MIWLIGAGIYAAGAAIFYTVMIATARPEPDAKRKLGYIDIGAHGKRKAA